MHHARNINARYVRRIDCRPTRDFPRSVVICIISVPASGAAKHRLALAVALIDVSAFHASARGVSSIDEDNRHPRALGFVGDKALQLVEGPTVQTAALLFTSPYPTAYPFQMFHRDTAPGALSNANDLFRNLVINVCRKTSLSAVSAAHQPLCGF